MVAAIATTVAVKVENKVGAMMPKGSTEPAEARTPITPVGKMLRPEVLIAKNSTMAFVATPGRRLRRLSSCIALMPKGVAALVRPIMFAAMFMIIAPMAGWSGGTSGKSRTITAEEAWREVPLALRHLKAFGIWEVGPEITIPVFENHPDAPRIAGEIRARVAASPPRVPGLLSREHGLTLWASSAQQLVNYAEVFDHLFRFMLQARMAGFD